jgi:hypothetical protein
MFLDIELKNKGMYNSIVESAWLPSPLIPSLYCDHFLHLKKGLTE